ncbi:unnamed protein product, partial [Tetraodon nigroviridis]
MKFEDVLAAVNGFGRFQIMVVLLSFVGRFTLPCHFFLNNFIAAIPSHHCDIGLLEDGGRYGNLTQAQKLLVALPVQEDGTPDSCRMFLEPQYHLLMNSSHSSGAATVPCRSGWVYDNSTFKSTLTSEWDLVCDQRGKNKATTTIFFVGVMFGAIFFGTVEWVDIKHRKLIGVIDSLAWTFGSTIFVGIAYLVNDWRWLIVAVTSPVLVAIFIWRWVPESARWLIASGKLEKAQAYLKTCAKMNRADGFSEALRTEVSPFQIIKTEQRSERSEEHRHIVAGPLLQTLASIVVTEEKGRVYTYLDLVRTPNMRRLAARTGLLWFCVATTFYGISFNIAGFGLNLYLTQLVYALIEFPTKIAIYYLLDMIGRRSSIVGALVLSGVCLGVNILIPEDMSVVRTVVAVFGKAFSSASFTVLILYSSELYPTVVRQNGMGFNSFMARVGVAVAPLILLLDELWKHLPQVILCGTAILGAMVAKTLRETRNRCLPETIEDVERH